MGPTSGVAARLRRHRLDRRMTQEALAELAGISVRTVAAIERGRGRSPRPYTVDRLATALRLTGVERDDFVRTGRESFWASRQGRRAPDAWAPYQLPPDHPDFVGRSDALHWLRRRLVPRTGPARPVVVSGPAGMGKSALAVHAATLLAEGFPDGQLFVALRGTADRPTDPAEALGSVLRALGVDGSAVPAGMEERAALFRARLSGRRVLILLDDADNHGQVEPLLGPGAAAVLVTSRLPLTGLAGAVSLDLGPMSHPEAIELLCRVAGADRVRAQPEAASALVTACGGLPLAVRIAGARLAARPQWTVETMTGRLADERRRLDELRHGDLAVRTTLESTHRRLGPDAARAFALLGGLRVSSFPEWTVVALLDSSARVAEAALDELLDARLVEGWGTDEVGQRQYRFHEVARLYAQERRETDLGESEWLAALGRVASGWPALARRDRREPTAVT